MIKWHCESNPLLEGVAEIGSIEEFGSKLRYVPITREDALSLTFGSKLEFLVGEHMTLFPTISLLRVGMLIWSAIRQSYKIRNPLISAGRRLVEDTIGAMRKGRDFLDQPGRPGASVIVIKGITGLGKSRLITRLMQLLGCQVVPHGRNEAARWIKATQLRYLYVALSHDGSRGGFLSGILTELDRALGTQYSVEIPRKFGTIDKRIPAIIALLHDYYLGVLIIDEIQFLNLAASDQATLMHLFLLNLANSGIPLVLVGNPLGFSMMSDFSQLASRIMKTEFLHPCGALPEKDKENWDRIFAGIWDYYFLPERPGNRAEFSVLLKLRSGGVGKYALELWCTAQHDALLAGKNSITIAAIETVYLSSAFDENRPLCAGFATRNPVLLMRWDGKDVPVDFYASAWGKASPPEATVGVAPPSGAKATATASPKRKAGSSGPARLKRAATRERKDNERRESLKDSLPPDDVRVAGLKNFHLKGLADLAKSSAAAKAAKNK